MADKDHTYCKIKVWVRRIVTFFGLIIGAYLIVGSYTFFKSNSGHPAGLLVLISGSLFFVGSLLDIILHSITSRIVTTLMIVGGGILWFVA